MKILKTIEYAPTDSQLDLIARFRTTHNMKDVARQMSVTPSYLSQCIKGKITMNHERYLQMLSIIDSTLAEDSDYISVEGNDD